jgi:hypothetical protein
MIVQFWTKIRRFNPTGCLRASNTEASIQLDECPSTLTTIPSFCLARCIVLELTLQKEATAGIDWKVIDVTSLPLSVKNSALSGLVTIQL